MKYTPIAPAAENTKQSLAALAEQIQTIKEVDPAADTSALQHRIDQAVYSLYRLTPQEITTLESAPR